MSTLGKVLVFLNLVAAIAVVAFIPLDYGRRRSWAYAAYLYDLRASGLPFDKEEKDENGVPKVNRLTPGVLADVFQGVGPPVATQAEELDRVKQALQARADGEGPGTKEQKLARILLPLARTFGEREALLRRLADDKSNKTDDLEEQLNRAFEEARAGGADARKTGAARLLVSLVEVLAEGEGGGEGNAPVDPFASGAYKRAIVVAGAPAVIREVDVLAGVRAEQARQAFAAFERDRSAFLAQHGRLVYALQNLADDLQRQQEFRDRVLNDASGHETLRDNRRVEVENARRELDSLRKDTQARLAEQARREQAVFEKLKEMRETARRNLDLEAELRRLEGEPRK